VGLWLLKPDVVWQEAIWIGAAAASYLLSSLAGLIKYRRIPSYHTQCAKIAWAVVSLSVITLFFGEVYWPFRVAMTFVVLTNLEAIAITCVIPMWRADVRSFYDALNERSGSADK
jgi:CDP-diacylglycerol--glycerol-3-phosphate 3-phosphatidyltransferase